MSINPEIRGLSIVVRGVFNPSIFHPQWFRSEGLIKDLEVEKALPSTVALPDFANFETDWFTIQVTQDRMSLNTVQDPYFERLRGLVIEIFNLLPHTPVAMLGINWDAHFKAPNEDRWHAFGHKIAPKEGVWDKILKNPGTQNVTVQEQPRADEYDGFIGIKVQPSSSLLNGIMIHMNDHYDFNREIKARDGSKILRNILENEWKSQYERWQKIYTHISSLV